MKILKFAPPLPEMILSGEKNTTWRVEDDKNICISDIFEFKDKDNIVFAKARIISVKNTTFGNLNDEDKNGHENFENDEIMYQTYEKYYSKKIFPETEVKVVKFEIIS